MLERRFFKGGQVRAKKGDAKGISGIASVYNQEYDNGWFMETIVPGAFDRALAEKQDVRCLFNHDPSNLLGRTASGTLRMADSKDGLGYECDLPDTQLGNDVLTLIDRGDLSGCSFGFNVRKQSWNDEFDGQGNFVRSIRTIEDVDLFDVGPVTYPAYAGTSVGTRALWPEGVPPEIRSHVAALRSDDEPTKTVDEEKLTRDCFLLAGDPDKTDTWALPWKFSTAAKTKSHLRDALARFDQVKGYSDEALDKAWGKLLMLCDHYGIDVADKTRPGAASEDDAERSRRDRLRVAEAF